MFKITTHDLTNQGPPKLYFLDESFKHCFSYFIETNSNNEKSIDFKFRSLENIRQSPCKDTERYPICKSYCDWHKNVIQQWNKTDFIAMMKHASPPRKIVQNSMTPFEKELLTKLFVDPKTKEDNETITGPLPLAIFCYDRSNGFIGDKVTGISEKLCNRFFPSPTDVGICQTKDSNIDEIMHSPKEYDSLFEPQLQAPIQRFSNNTIGSKATLVLYADGENDLRQTLPRSSDANLDEMEFLIHSPNELGRFIHDENFERELASLQLMAGNEYFIDVTPRGTKVSDEFKSQDFKTRKCYTELDSLPNLKRFKKYTRNNCKYECHVMKARELCNCIPWDFITDKQAKEECDVFGRSCFFDTIWKLSQSDVDQCHHCKELCETTEYYITRVVREPMNSKFQADVNSWTVLKDRNKKWIVGDRELVDFFMDKNHSMSDKSFKEVFNAYGYPYDRSKYYEWLHYQRHKKLIIVHLEFQKPKFKKIDLKYTPMDKIANFGGKFGIFAQITGCSLLAIIKIILIIIKTLFNIDNNN